MITPRRTRLVRVPDVRTFRRAILAIAEGVRVPERAAIIVPTRAAAQVFADGVGHRLLAPGGLVRLLTREELYDELHARLSAPPRRLSAFEREAMAQAAAHAAALSVGELPFTIRPGLVAEILRFYDQLRRQSQPVKRFEELMVEALGGGEVADRGAERLLLQTRFLAQAFREYEERVAGSDACDEHTLRARLAADPAPVGLRHIVVTMPDWIADPAGLFVADFELLARLPGLHTLDLVCTASVLGSGFHERLHRWWPGVEEVEASTFLAPLPPVRPQLVHAPNNDGRLWTTHRDREEELIAVARRLGGAPDTWARAAVVFKRPLPYLYIAPDTLGAAGVTYRLFDTLPLAAEPAVTAVDLALDAVETSFSRESLVALAMSPHVVHDVMPLTRGSIAAMNHVLSEARYLGGIDRLERLTAAAGDGVAAPALHAALALARELAILLEPAPASQQIGQLVSFLSNHLKPLTGVDPLADQLAGPHPAADPTPHPTPHPTPPDGSPGHSLSDRERRAATAVTRLLDGLAAAHSAHHDPDWTLADLASSVRRWIADQTFVVDAGSDAGIRLLDDQAARYGEFDDVTIVGLIEHEWPERPRRNIFYPPGLLKALNWPSEKDRRGADDARFLDLLASASRRVELSTFTLDDEALVTRSVQLDEVPTARLTTVVAGQRLGKVPDGATSDESPFIPTGAHGAEWASLRSARTPAADSAFHGFTGPRPSQAWSVSALETYIGCPFKFFAQYVLKLEEEPDDEEVMDPRRQGQFVHEVFETFFTQWQDAGHKAITPTTLDVARRLFRAVVDGALEKLPEGERALERTRLLGSSAASGLGEAVFRMEAERPVPVVERLLEHPLKGAFTLSTARGPRVVDLRGKADRVDLLADGTFRLIDYKLGWPPDRGRALQLPIYSVCAEQRLAGYREQTWTLGEAVYLAFKGPKRVVPLFSTREARAEVLANAQQRLADTIDAIGRGDFPPSPDDVHRCETCSFTSVCRKDYVGDV